MAGKSSGENLPLLEHKHIEILDRGGLWESSVLMTMHSLTLILLGAEGYIVKQIFHVTFCLTLKRLGGGGSQFDPPSFCGFS